MASDVKWIKITTDIFDDDKILLIESLPDADSIIVIWFKLLCLAGKQNNSGVFMMSNSIPYTDKMLSTIFRRKDATVQLALTTFEQFGMIEIVDGVITIPNWGKHQNLERLEERRKYQREYQKEYRQRQKLLASTDDEESKCLRKHLHEHNVNTLEEDKEKETDKKEDNKIYSSVISYLNEKVGTNYRPSSKKTQSCINARVDEGFTLDDFKTVIDKKAEEWIGTEFEAYLRPETLFGTKFESYLNAKIRPKITGKKEAVPEWMKKETEEKELEDLKRMHRHLTIKTVGTDPDLAARADELKSKLGL